MYLVKNASFFGDGASLPPFTWLFEDLGAKSITHLSRKTAPLYTDAP